MISIATITQINNKDKATLVRETINTNFVNLNNEVSNIILDLVDLNSKIGELDKLKTYIKTSIVNSINQLTEEISILETGPAIIKEPFIPSYSYARGWSLAAATNDHFIIYGGQNVNGQTDDYSKSFGSFSKEMVYNGLLPVKSTAVSPYYCKGISFDNKAVFPNNANYINYFDNNLTFKTMNVPSLLANDGIGSANENHIVIQSAYRANSVFSFSKDMESSLINNRSFDNSGSTYIEDNILFTAGRTPDIFSTAIVSYNNSNVKTEIGNISIPTSYQIAGTIKSNFPYAVFGGGVDKPGNLLRETYSVDRNLVVNKITGTQTDHLQGMAVSTGKFVLFAGGRNINILGISMVESYDSNLIQSVLPYNLSTPRFQSASNNFGKKAIFACGRTVNGSTMTNTIDVYKEVSLG